MEVNLIVGRNSNLSQHLANHLTNASLVSSRDIMNNISILNEFENVRLNVIFNNFQPAVRLNDTSSPVDYINNSILVTAKILEYIKEFDINKIIYTSSSSVYGTSSLCQEDNPVTPVSFQAALKVANEKLIERFCRDNNINFTITRVFNMYGGNDQFSIIHKIINTIKNNQALTLYNHGSAIRDFIHIDDVVEVYSKILLLQDIQYINVGTGRGVSIKDLLDFLKQRNINIKFKNIDQEELKSSIASTLLLHQVIKKEKFRKLEEFVLEELSK